MMHKYLLSAAALAAAAPALAADIPYRQEPPPAYAPPPLFTWSGLYLGGQIGYGWGTDSVSLNPFGFSTSYTPNGVVGGAHVGYNFQFNQFVAGIEGDVEGTGISRTYNPGGLVIYETQLPVQGSIRGRLGVAFDRVLIYATGGAAFAGFDTSLTTFGVDQASPTLAGWTVGGGLEFAVTNNWSIRAEYRYADYGTFTQATPFTFGIGTSANHHETQNAVRAGFSYKFDPFGVPHF